ncbi:hypothetical protein AX17_006858 [Amanita inopinata Kibby_2008]|nr:hypothetical protein AX17_006858 [Amanita inopinata Kibby_2008]
MQSKEMLPPPEFVNPFISKWSGPDDQDEEALQRSRQIDAVLSESKKAFENRKNAVKLLLLGQSESGKSSVLKNFQLAFAPKHFEHERLVWKVVIQLNLIGQVRILLDLFERELACKRAEAVSQTSHVDNSRRYRLSLSPLFNIESNLLSLICPDNKARQDVCVRAGNGWKERLREAICVCKPSDARCQMGPLASCELDPTPALAAAREGIISLWNDEYVGDILKKKKVQMRGTAGFFLDDVARIATLSYVPTDRDAIRARIRTVGAEEHSFKLEIGPECGSYCYVTDVGGSKYSRATWASFFDDVQAIIFMAPLAFDQYLEEDSTVNRLEDSIALWKETCSNKLLANANLVLFLNKRDVLEATLAAGAKVKKFIPSYTEPNDIASVTEYFKNKFKGYHKRRSPRPRSFVCYETSAIDTNSMGKLLSQGQEIL